MKADEGGTTIEYEAGDGTYYCPGCGARFDTPGLCTGTAESPHEELHVERTGPKPAAPKPAAKPAAKPKAASSK